MLYLPANVVSMGLSVANTTRQHFLFFEMTYSAGNRLREQKMRPSAHHLHFDVLRATRDPSARHRRRFSTYQETAQRLAGKCTITGHSSNRSTLDHEAAGTRKSAWHFHESPYVSSGVVVYRRGRRLPGEILPLLDRGQSGRIRAFSEWRVIRPQLHQEAEEECRPPVPAFADAKGISRQRSDF